MNRNIDRLRAEQDMRGLMVAAIAQSEGETIKEQQENYREQLEQPVVMVHTKPEEGGLSRLKQLSEGK